MPVRVCVLSSGSAGNCLWVEAAGLRVLVDAGLPLRETRRRCAEAGLDLRDASDLLLTHEHADHAGCAGVLARKLGLRVHATRGTLAAMRDRPPEELLSVLYGGIAFRPGRAAIIPLRGESELWVTPLAVPHDASAPVAFLFEERGARESIRAAFVTDLGCAPAVLSRALRGLDLLLLEMNHDVRLLLDGPYPFRLKQRVRSDLGHLSNAQGAALLAQTLHEGLRHVVLAHLSEHNNTPRLAQAAAEAVLARAGSGARLSLASQTGALLPIELPLGARFRTARPQQLSLQI